MHTFVRLLFAIPCFALLGCTERVVYVYPDGGPSVDAAPTDAGALDAPSASDGGAPEDAPPVAPGTCEPDRVSGEVGHTDCRPTPSTPICDAISERCVASPTDYCGACATDEQCANFDLQARCVFIPGDANFNNDSACLHACAADGDCAFLVGTPGWTSGNARGFALPEGSFCVPDNGGVPHCRDASGNRIGGS